MAAFLHPADIGGRAYLAQADATEQPQIVIISAAGRASGLSSVTATSEFIAVASGSCVCTSTVNAASAISTGGLSAGAAITIELLPSPFIFELIPT